MIIDALVTTMVLLLVLVMMVMEPTPPLPAMALTASGWMDAWHAVLCDKRNSAIELK